MTQEKIEIAVFDPQTIQNPIQLKMSKDGTNYEIIALYLPHGITCGYMQNSQPCVLIISGYDKSAYSFAIDQYTSWDYIAEKLCKHYNKTDAENLKILIDKAKEELKQ